MKSLFTGEKEDVAPWYGWYLFPDLGKEGGWLYNPGNDSDKIPFHGWEETINGSFVPAPNITVRLGGLEACKEVRVTAKVKGVKSAGVYLPTGEWSNGRPVYRQLVQPYLYMLVPNSKQLWMTQTNPNSNTAWMISNRGGNSPAEVPVDVELFDWMHSGDNNLKLLNTLDEMKKVGWKTDAGIDVTCVCANGRCS